MIKLVYACLTRRIEFLKCFLTRVIKKHWIVKLVMTLDYWLHWSIIHHFLFLIYSVQIAFFFELFVHDEREIVEKFLQTYRSRLKGKLIKIKLMYKIYFSQCNCLPVIPLNVHKYFQLTCE